MLYSVNYLSPAAILIGLVSIAILLIWNLKFFKNKKIFRYIPGPLVVVVAGILISEGLNKAGTRFTLSSVVTILAILFSDLLIGILIGVGVALFFLVRSNFRSAVMIVHDENKYLVRLRKDVSFLNKPIVKEKLESVPENSFVLIDITRANFIDKDIIDAISEFMHHAHLKKIKVEIRKSQFKSAHQLVGQMEPAAQDTGKQAGQPGELNEQAA